LGKDEGAEVAKKKAVSELKCFPVTSKRWPDFEALFGKRGACGGLW
jgi:hypothetical protein